MATTKKATTTAKKTATKKAAEKKVAKKTTAKKAASKATKKTTKKKVATKNTAPKKSTTKAATKTAKKSTKKKTAETKVLVCAADKECFWVTDGQILKDLAELKDALKSMSDEVFAHHVTKEENHFADWVEHVLCDADCAAALRRSRSRSGARTVVVRHLKYYTL